MPFVVLQRTPQPLYRSNRGVDIELPGLYVVDINSKKELVLGDERGEAVKFDTKEEAKKAVAKATSNTNGCEIIELMGPDWVGKASTPAGFALLALEGGAVTLGELREKMPPYVVESMTESDMLTVVKAVHSQIPVPPPACEVILTEDHARRSHAGRRATPHAHGIEASHVITSGTPYEHDHNEDLDQLRREVKYMATATKAKPKGQAKAKKEKVLRDCHCGCGGQTYSNFTPGHDARVYSLLKKQAKGEKVKLPKILTDNADLLKEMKAKVH
jgi:hypothetical protein